MGLYDRFDVEPLLVAEVVVDGRDVRPGRLTDSRTVVDSNPRSANICPAASIIRSRVVSKSFSAMIYRLY